MALAVSLAIFALFAGSVYSNILYANQYSITDIGYGYSISGEWMKWITTMQSDFECSGSGNRSHVDTWSSPSNVTLEKAPVYSHWWNSSWQYRMLINVMDNSGSKLENYQVLATLTSKTFNYSKADANGNDIRFTLYNSSANNESKLSYWIEEWNISGESKVWVNVTEILASGTNTIYMYYGNEGATSENNRSATMLWFDDFSTDTTALYNSIGVDEGPSISGGYMEFSELGGPVGLNHSIVYPDVLANQANVVIRTRVMVTQMGNPGGWWGVWARHDGNDTNPTNYGFDAKPPAGAYDEKPVIERFNSGIRMQLTGAQNTMAIGVWYNTTGRICGTDSTVYMRYKVSTFDELIYDDSSASRITNSGIVGMGAYENTTVRYDYFEARKVACPEPTINMGAEESNTTWMDYFGGTAAISNSVNVTVSNGVARLNTTSSSSITLYDFSSGAGSDKWAYRYQVSGKPPSANDVPATEFASSQYGKIDTNDGMMQNDGANSRGYHATHRFVFQISENEENISYIDVFWNGRGESNGFSAGEDGVTLYIWNYTSGNYAELDSNSDASEVDLTGTIAASVENFIDADGNITILTEQNADYLQWWFFIRTSELWTDYVSVNVTTTEYTSYGNLTSVAVSPAGITYWDKFYASDSGEEITYKILNASSGNVLCVINSSQANAGYDISSCDSGVNSIKLYAELTTNGSVTPILHGWKVSWHPVYYGNGYLISCSYDTGSSTNYSTISWNATLPAGTAIKFRISSSSDGLTWTEFLGSDGANSTYYTISGTNIWGGHDGDRYIKYKAYLETSNKSVTPVLQDVTIIYMGG